MTCLLYLPVPEYYFTMFCAVICVANANFTCVPLNHFVNIHISFPPILFSGVVGQCLYSAPMRRDDKQIIR
jgi:hypothetical protein